MAHFKLVSCPICGGKLEIDLDNGQIYRHFEKRKEKQAIDAFDAVVGKVAEKENSTEDTFHRATEKLRTKDLESLFRQATEKAKDAPEEEEGEEEDGGD